jgi:hypothetical protein
MRHPAVRPAIGTGLLLLLPAVMSVLDRHKPAGDGWHWGPLDFVAMGLLLFCAGLAWELLAPRFRRAPQRAMLAIVILSLVLGIWTELAVGGISRLAGYVSGFGSPG